MFEKKSKMSETKSIKEKLAYNFRFWKISFFSYCIFGALQFLILTTIAIFYYSGGAWNNFQNSGYSFIWNFLSDLGSIYSLSGEYNLVSRILFTISVSFVGLAVISFSNAFIFMPQKKNLEYYRIIPLTTGTLYGLLYSIIANLPSDEFYLLHTVLVAISCSLKVFTMAFFVIMIYKFDIFPKILAIGFISYLIFFFLFAYSLVVSAIIPKIPFFPICIVGQKITFYLEAILYIFQSAILIRTQKMSNNYSP